MMFQNPRLQVFTGFCLLLLLSLSVSGCGRSAVRRAGDRTARSQAEETGNQHSEEFFAMDTFMSITVFGDDGERLAGLARGEVERLDHLLSTGDEESEVARLNQSGSAILSADGRELLRRSLELFRDTDGAFDVTVFPLMELWGFTGGGEPHVPKPKELEETLTLVGSGGLLFDEKTGEVGFSKPGMKLGFGGIAKGYASARCAGLLKAEGAESALINLGGNVQAVGTKPDGSPWRIGIRMPDGSQSTDRFLCILELSDCAVITSGGYERNFEEDGVTYHHILDPKTGYPADTDLLSVTVVSTDGTEADALATALFVMGEEGAEAYWREHASSFGLVLALKDGSIAVTDRLAEHCTTELSMKVISVD